MSATMHHPTQAGAGAAHRNGKQKKKKRGFRTKLKGFFGFGKGKKKSKKAPIGFDPDALYQPPLTAFGITSIERALRHLNACGALGLKGLYRVTGNVSTVAALATYMTTGSLENGPFADLAHDPDPIPKFHARDIAGAVKKVLREAEPLCTYTLSQQFLDAAGS